MKNAITTLRIQNFKSIKDVEMKPRRVNILIGEPNVGKSNILEAMSLLGGMVYEQTKKFMGSFIRYEEPRQLFYDNRTVNTIKVTTDRDICVIVSNKVLSSFHVLLCDRENYEVIENRRERKPERNASIDRKTLTTISDFINIIDRNESPGAEFLEFVYTEVLDSGDFLVTGEPNKYRTNEQAHWSPDIRPYIFSKRGVINKEHDESFLYPPYGDNLISIVQSFPALRAEMTRLFKHYGLKPQIRVDDNRLDIIKDLDGFIYSYPYSSIADTLQRLIFYLAAIESNDDAVILLEEPEAHSFPVYVSQLGQRIVESRNNQFFVATHSPYLITEILEAMLTNDELTPELAMFVAYYEDYQTKVRQLSDEEVLNIRRDGLDVFYNMDRFVPQR